MQVHPLLQLFLQDYRTDTIEVCGLQIPALAEDQILEMVQEVAESEELVLEDHGAAAVVHVAMGDLRRAITALQVAASLSNNITRDLVYETTATAPPEQLTHFYGVVKRTASNQPGGRCTQ